MRTILGCVLVSAYNSVGGRLLHRRIYLSVFVGLLLTWFCSGALAQQSSSWKFFRGEDYSGHSNETGLASSWPDKGPPVLWTRDLGVGYSGFVGEAGRIYTQYQSNFGQYVICMDSQTGKTVWEHRYAWPYKPAMLYPGPRSTPTLSNGRLYFTTPKARLICLNADNGEKLWEVDTATKFEAPAAEFGFACSPVVEDGRAFLPVGGKDASMVSFDSKDGTVVWQSGNEPISYCSAFPIKFDNRKLIVGYFQNSLCIFDQNDGSVLAIEHVSSGYDEHSAWPIFQAPYLWTAGPFRKGSHLFELRSTSTGLKLKLNRRSPKLSNDVASSVLADGKLFGYDIRDVQSKVHRPSRGQFICVDFLTGEVHWTNGTLGRRSEGEVISSKVAKTKNEVGHATVIVADGKLILFNDTGDLILCEATAESYTELARSKVLGGEIVWTHPMLMDGCIFVRNHNKSVCVFLRDPKELTSQNVDFQFANEIAQPRYINWAYIVMGTEPKYAMTSPKLSWLCRWYLLSMAGGWVLAPTFAFVYSKLASRPSRRTVFLALAFLIGLFATTAFGHLRKEFIFSWPIALAILFECLVCLTKNDEKDWLQNLRARIFLYGFAGICLAYFLLCRRLSLAFEWSFLIGFPSAIPFLWILRKRLNEKNDFGFSQLLLSGMAFTAFYWTGAGVMLWKYAY